MATPTGTTLENLRLVEDGILATLPPTHPMGAAVRAADEVLAQARKQVEYTHAALEQAKLADIVSRSGRPGAKGVGIEQAKLADEAAHNVLRAAYAACYNIRLVARCLCDRGIDPR